MQITVVEQFIDGLPDLDYPVLVYEGHLTNLESAEISEELGGIGKGGYATYELHKNAQGGVNHVTFLRESGNDGDLTLFFTHTETKRIG